MANIRIFNAVFKQNSAHHHDFSNLKTFHKLLICADEVTGEIGTDIIWMMSHKWWNKDDIGGVLGILGRFEKIRIF